MSTTIDARDGPRRPGLLDKARTVASPGYDRWLVPPAAIAVHLCIGMIYGMSVFWLPLTKAIGKACPADIGFLDYMTTTSCDWAQPSLVVGFEIAIVCLGAAAATWGGWLERVGPRRAGVVAALCWPSGLAVAAWGVAIHQLWLLWLGMGVLGGIGLGIGYISPVSTLVRWFPDRRGMATGMAIMGFGGGAMIGAPLANMLMSRFKGPGDPGVWETFLVLAVVYLVYMLCGSLGYRIPREGWSPATGVARDAVRAPMPGDTAIGEATRTHQFWLLWIVLAMNVSAGIGVLSVASPMLQQIFSASPATAAGFVGLLSLFNIGGRFAWASVSDHIGRKATYAVFFLLGIALYLIAPWAAHAGSKALFVAAFCVVLSMYGGGFATIPAYLADLFGTRNVGAIHGRLLTAWSTAGVLGPLLVTLISQQAIAAGQAKAAVYDTTLYVLAGLLAVGFVADMLVRPLAGTGTSSPVRASPPVGGDVARAGLGGRPSGSVVVAWSCVLIPIAWGVWMTLSQVSALFPEVAHVLGMMVGN